MSSFTSFLTSGIETIAALSSLKGNHYNYDDLDKQTELHLKKQEANQKKNRPTYSSYYSFPSANLEAPTKAINNISSNVFTNNNSTATPLLLSSAVSHSSTLPNEVVTVNSLLSSLSASSAANNAQTASLQNGLVKKALTHFSTDPRIQLAGGVFALLAFLLPGSTRVLRNINIEITADKMAKTYVIGLGNHDHERRVALRIASGAPIRFEKEPGVNVDKMYALEEGQSTSQSSFGFSTLFGLLNFFSYNKKEKMNIINIIVSDPFAASYLNKGPKITKVQISEEDLIQVIQVKASQKAMVLNKLGIGTSNSQEDSAHLTMPDRIQVVSLNANTLEFDKLANGTDHTVVSLPEFDKKDDEFIHITVHNHP